MEKLREEYNLWKQSLEGKKIEECGDIFKAIENSLELLSPEWKNLSVNLRIDESAFEEDPITKETTRLKENNLYYALEGKYYDVRAIYKLFGDIIENLSEDERAEKFTVLKWEYHFLESLLNVKKR